MHITGYDYIFYAPLPPKKFLKRFRKQIKKHIWHEYLEDYHHDRQDDSILAYFQKDEAMDLFSDYHAYSLNEEGEGPFAIFTSKYRTHNVQSIARDLTLIVDGVEFNDEALFQTVYICRKTYRYTLVLPANIDTDPFSKRVHDYAFASCIKKLK